MNPRVTSILVLAFAVVCVFGSEDAENCAHSVATTLLQLHITSRPRQPQPHPWPQKNGDSMRTGRTNLVAGTNLSQAAWVYNEPGSSVIYASPVLDSYGNAILTSTNGSVFSIRVKDGSPNWLVSLGGSSAAVPTPILIGDALYITDGRGTFYSLALSDGSELWRLKISDAESGSDAYSMGGLGEIVLFVSTRHGDPNTGGSGSRLFAVNIVNKSVLWEFELVERVFNIIPAIFDNRVFVASTMGGLTCLHLLNGTMIWHQPGFGGAAFTTGGMSIGPNGLIYVTGNSDSGCSNFPGMNPSNCGDGHLRAWDKDGTLRWNRTFINVPVNNAPSVYQLSSGDYAVTIGLGRNPLASFAISEIDLFLKRDSPDQVVALKADTGEDLWAFDAPAWSSQAGAGSTSDKVCWPDTWSNAAIDGAGTLYIGWLGGEAFALSGDTGALIGSYTTTSSVQGAPGLSSGVLIVAACNNVAAFLA